MGSSPPRQQPLPPPPSTIDQVSRDVRNRLRLQARGRSGFGAGRLTGPIGVAANAPSPTLQATTNLMGARPRLGR